MKKITALSLALISLAASAQVPYKVIVPVPDEEAGTPVYCIDWDAREYIDTAYVADNKVVFTGDIDEPIIAVVKTDNATYGTFVLEQGTCTINQQSGTGVGTMYNDILKSVMDQLNEIVGKASQVETEDELNALFEQFIGIGKKAIADNADNPIGAYLFCELSYDLGENDAIEILQNYPQLKESKRVAQQAENISRKLETSEGKMFKDFEVTYEGATKKLSDYVGKGDYVLVDFFASWCGPCMREIETIREIYNNYSDKGLKVLGVAVWDDPENTKGTIESKNIPWECILDAQSIPTDLYGINGIPCVILFGPDGTILSRDKQGINLINAVAAALD